MLLALYLLLACTWSTDGQACIDQDERCLDWAVKGRCTSDFEDMKYTCRATCNLCSVSAKETTVDEGDDTRVPLMFSGQFDGGHQKSGWAHRSEEDDGGVVGAGEFEAGEGADAVWVGGDVRIRVYQPVLAGECCWGEMASIRSAVL